MKCFRCAKSFTYDKKITFVGSLPGKLGPISVHLCNPCSKNNQNMTLKEWWKRNDGTEVKNLLDKMIDQGENNANIGSFVSRSNIRYGADRYNPFCNNPLSYVSHINLTEQYKLLDDFIKPITDFLEDNTSPHKQQGLISNGYQTDGNLFEDETIDTNVIEKIIHLEVEKYREKFKDNEEGFLNHWPEEYTLNGW